MQLRAVFRCASVLIGRMPGRGRLVSAKVVRPAVLYSLFVCTPLGRAVLACAVLVRAARARAVLVWAVLLPAVGAVVVCAFAGGNAALAQPVDYGAFEQIFGEPVTTSVTGKPQRVTDAPANIEIITQDDIRRSGAINIPEVLQFVTGLDVRLDGFSSADVG